MKKMFGVLAVVFAILVMPVFAKDLFLKVKNEGADQGNVAQAAMPQSDVGLPMRTFRLNYADVKQAKDSIKDVLGNGEAVSANEGTNSLVVRASAKSMDSVAKVIKNLDRLPLQVNVESKILELKSGSGDTSNPSTFGFSWIYRKTPGSDNFAQFFSTDTPTTGAIAQGLYAQLLGGNVNAFLQAVEKKIGYDFVASPWITALNHQEAEILIGQKIGYRNLLTTTTGTLQEVQYIEVGTKLKLTPHISDDGYIRMSIFPSLSDGVLVDGVPQTTNTETRNSVLIKDGQTVVIGGLTRSYKNEVTVGVPVLSSIPIIGTLFRRKELHTEKRDLMVLITPHIVTPEFLKKMKDKADKLDASQEEKKNEGGPFELMY